MKHNWKKVNDDWVFCHDCSSPWPNSELMPPPEDGCQKNEVPITVGQQFDMNMLYNKFIASMMVKKE